MIQDPKYEKTGRIFHELKGYFQEAVQEPVPSLECAGFEHPKAAELNLC